VSRRRIDLSCPREGQAEDFAAGYHVLMPQNEKQEGGREEGRGGRAGFRARVVAKPTLRELHISLLLATVMVPAVWSGGGGKRRATKGKHRGHRVAR